MPLSHCSRQYSAITTSLLTRHFAAEYPPTRNLSGTFSFAQVLVDKAPPQPKASAAGRAPPKRSIRENEKLQLAKSIMKKLYFKCVELEKELKLLRARKNPTTPGPIVC